MIRDARQRTVAFGSYISGLANTGGKNTMNLTLDDISVRSGEIDGFFHFFINWHRKELLPTRGDACKAAARLELLLSSAPCDKEFGARQF